MELIIAKQLGGIRAVISENMKDVSLEGIGKAYVSYASMRPEHVTVNAIETNPYDVETNLKILGLIKAKGLNIKYRVQKDENGKIRKVGIGSSGFRFGLHDEQKKLIAEKIREKHEQFRNDLMAGKIPIYISIVGCDFPHPVLSIDEQPQYGIKTWDLCYQLLGEKYGIYDKVDFIPPEKLNDKEVVTEYVIRKIRELDKEAELKELRQKEEEAQQKAAVKKAFQEELFIFGDEPLAAVGNRLLHSIGAIISKKTNEIRIYTTSMTRFMKEPNTTHTIKEILKEKGFTWDKERKMWRIEYSDKNVEFVIETLKKYDSKEDPRKLGLARCWECGRWCYPSELDETGYCGC